MHANPLFRWDDRVALRAFAERIGFGTLFATTPDGPGVAHLPFVFLGENRVGFHLSRANPLTRHVGAAEAVLVINGPDGYVSPDWYGVDDQVPTWNYLALELRGTVTRMDRAWLAEQTDSLSDVNEVRLCPKPVWKRDKMSEGLFDKMLGAIVGFELQASDWRGTAKLGQNKSEAVRLAAAAQVEAAGNQMLANAMRSPPNG
jgi:transcriptional regulator